MSKADGAVAWAVAIANNPSHGYDQTNRWGPNYDCSSLVISAWESVGVAVREAGASYTKNMYKAFRACGFVDVTASVDRATGRGMLPGDVVLNHSSHTAMVVREGMLVAARINEQGTATGGMSGDQTGREICQQSYYNYPWDCVLRYGEDTNVPTTPGQAVIIDKPDGAVVADGGETAKPTQTCTVQLPVLRMGDGINDPSDAVRAAQLLLKGRGFRCGALGADGEFGPATYGAVCAFQCSRALETDGVIGTKTWAALIWG